MTAFRSRGWVRFFDEQKGFGSIRDVALGDDVFVHYSNLRLWSRGWRSLQQGEAVEFLRFSAPRGPAALEVTGVGSRPLLCELEDGRGFAAELAEPGREKASRRAPETSEPLQMTKRRKGCASGAIGEEQRGRARDEASEEARSESSPPKPLRHPGGAPPRWEGRLRRSL